MASPEDHTTGCTRCRRLTWTEPIVAPADTSWMFPFLPTAALVPSLLRLYWQASHTWTRRAKYPSATCPDPGFTKSLSTKKP